MSGNESRKRAARDFQAANPGMSYTRARRQVTHGQRRLTALLGKSLDGANVTVDLEWASRGGSGPHCLIVGAEVPALLAVLAAGLAAAQRPADLELVVCGSESTQLTVEHRRVDPIELVGLVDDVLASRRKFLCSIDVRDVVDAREHGHPVPTTVVLIEDHGGTWGTSEALSRWLRVGRSAGLNLVVGFPAAAPLPTAIDDTSPAQMLDRFLRATQANPAVVNMTTATIFSLGDRRATLRIFGRRNPDRRVREPDVLTDFTFTAPQP